MDLQAISRRIKAAQDEAGQMEPMTAAHPQFDLDAAYRVAGLVHGARIGEGAVVRGRKIGFTNPAMWDVYGVRAPIWGHVYGSTLVPLSGHARFSLRPFADPKIEPEIALHFHRVPPVGADPAAILDCVDQVAHAFEIVQSHFPGWKFRAADTIADGGLHGALLLGPPRPVESLGRDPAGVLASFSVAISCDGSVRETGKGSNVLGSPLAAVAHLIEVLSRQEPLAPLQANEWVTTGTLTAAYPVRAGETWTTELQGIALPGLSVEFIA